MSNVLAPITIGDTPPVDTAALWLSTSVKHLRAPQGVGDRKVIIEPTMAWEANVCQEPDVWYRDIGTGRPWHMIYTGGSQLGYASAATPRGPWVKAAGPILGDGVKIAGHAYHASVYVEDDTLYLYFPEGYSTAGKWRVATAPVTDPTNLTVQATAVFTPPANAQSATLSMGNTSVLKDDDGTYVLIYEATFANQYQMGYAFGTSPLGPFTHQSIPLYSVRPTFPGAGQVQNGGQDLYKENGTYVLYYHAGPDGLPTQGYRATSQDLNTWVIDNAGQPLVRRTAAFEVDQVADLALCRAPNGASSLFWSGMNNNTAGALTGRIYHAQMQPQLMQFDGADWVPIVAVSDTSAPKSFHRRATLAAEFTTTTVNSDTAVTGLSLFYQPDLNMRVTAKLRVKVKSSLAGAVEVSLTTTPAPYTGFGTAPFPTGRDVAEDMAADKYRTFTVEVIVDCVAGTGYTFAARVKNTAAGATTTVAPTAEVTAIELLAIAN